MSSPVCDMNNHIQRLIPLTISGDKMVTYPPQKLVFKLKKPDSSSSSVDKKLLNRTFTVRRACQRKSIGHEVFSVDDVTRPREASRDKSMYRAIPSRGRSEVPTQLFNASIATCSNCRCKSNAPITRVNIPFRGRSVAPSSLSLKNDKPITKLRGKTVVPQSTRRTCEENNNVQYSTHVEYQRKKNEIITNNTDILQQNIKRRNDESRKTREKNRNTIIEKRVTEKIISKNLIKPVNVQVVPLNSSPNRRTFHVSPHQKCQSRKSFGNSSVSISARQTRKNMNSCKSEKTSSLKNENKVKTKPNSCNPTREDELKIEKGKTTNSKIEKDVPMRQLRPRTVGTKK